MSLRLSDSSAALSESDDRSYRAPGKVALTQRMARGTAPSAPSPVTASARAAVQRAALAHELAAAFGFAEHPLDRPDAAAAAVQRHGDAHTGLSDDAIATHAAAGVSGAGGVMPHLESIQRAFGPTHDLSGVRAHVGGAAADASSAIGAHAYATGNDIAFASSPDLFLAAHEATHIVQQRQGVHLKGAVGQAGDSYEQHADTVAAAVVRGEDVSELLGSGEAVATAAVQRTTMILPEGGETSKEEAMASLQAWRDASFKSIDDLLTWKLNNAAYFLENTGEPAPSEGFLAEVKAIFAGNAVGGMGPVAFAKQIATIAAEVSAGTEDKWEIGRKKGSRKGPRRIVSKLASSGSLADGLVKASLKWAWKYGIDVVADTGFSWVFEQLTADNRDDELKQEGRREGVRDMLGAALGATGAATASRTSVLDEFDAISGLLLGDISGEDRARICREAAEARWAIAMPDVSDLTYGKQLLRTWVLQNAGAADRGSDRVNKDAWAKSAEALKISDGGAIENKQNLYVHQLRGMLARIGLEPHATATLPTIGAYIHTKGAFGPRDHRAEGRELAERAQGTVLRDLGVADPRVLATALREMGHRCDAEAEADLATARATVTLKDIDEDNGCVVVSDVTAWITATASDASYGVALTPDGQNKATNSGHSVFGDW
jgi:hypothetical protein